MLRAVRSRFVASVFLLRISFTPFANQVKCYSWFLVISESMATKFTLENGALIKAIFAETYQRAPFMRGALVEVFVVFILTRACTIIELGDTLRVIVVEYSWDTWSLMLLFRSPRYVGLSLQDRIIASVTYHVKIRSVRSFAHFICPVFDRRLASALILIFCSSVFDISSFFLLEWNFGFSSLEIRSTFLLGVIMSLPRAFGPRYAALGNLARAPNRLFLNLWRSLAFSIH